MKLAASSVLVIIAGMIAAPGCGELRREETTVSEPGSSYEIYEGSGCPYPFNYSSLYDDDFDSYGSPWYDTNDSYYDEDWGFETTDFTDEQDVGEADLPQTVDVVDTVDIDLPDSDSQADAAPADLADLSDLADSGDLGTFSDGGPELNNDAGGDASGEESTDAVDSELLDDAIDEVADSSGDCEACSDN